MILIVQLELIAAGFFLGVREREVILLLLYLLPILLARLVQEEVAHNVEELDGEFVVTAKGLPAEEHMCDFSEGEGGMWMDELNVCLLQVDVPLGEVGVREYQ